MTRDAQQQRALSARYAPTPGLIQTDLESELVLLDPATQQMFSLNPTGRTLWFALREHPLRDAVAQVTEQFDVSLEQATADALALVGDLCDAGLLQRVEE